MEAFPKPQLFVTGGAMRGFYKGLIAGAAVAVAVLTGYAYGEGRGEERALDEAESRCQVQVGFARATFDTQCRFDSVMVGYRDGSILCADVTVSCD
jgi:hypothetical protein